MCVVFKIITVQVASRIEYRGEKLEMGSARRLLHSSGVSYFGNGRVSVAGMKMKGQVFSHPIILALPILCTHYPRPVTAPHPKPDCY